MFSDFKPLNQRGQPLSDVLKPNRAQRRAADRDLYQVMVETRAGEIIPVGPKVIQRTAERVCEAIHKQICLGREKTWFNPIVVRAQTGQSFFGTH